MLIENNIKRGIFICRPNRFQAHVILDNTDIVVHVPNTGRCREILKPGTTVILREETNPARKTLYDLIAAYKGERLINIDSQIPNKVVWEALHNKKIKLLKEYNIIEKEKTFGNSRLDFKVSDESGDEYFLEVKGVTFEENQIAMFPDAPTERGRKHLLELIDIKKTGRGAGVLFLIQMMGLKCFSPYDYMDSKFGEALRLAKKNGVDILAYDCSVGEKFITLDKEVTIVL